jgi:catechol 2,3-dioxygenase-like lactoylglutathione lyase family enzyme
MRIHLTSLFVDDQRAALAFYTEVLGFTKHRDVPIGEDSWLTVVSPTTRTEPNCCSNRPATPRSSPSGMHSPKRESR